MLCLWKVLQPACVISMQVGQQNPPNIFGVESDCQHLWTYFFFGLDPFLNAIPVIWMPAREITRFPFISQHILLTKTIAAMRLLLVEHSFCKLLTITNGVSQKYP